MSKASYNKALDHFLSIVAPIESDRKSVIGLCESLGADARELGEVVYIEDHTDMQPTLPFFAPFYIFEALFAFTFGKFVDSYYQYRFVRADKILPMYVLKKAVASLKHFRNFMALHRRKREAAVPI